MFFCGWWHQVAFPLVVYSATFVLGLLGNILILVAVGSQNQVCSLVLVLSLLNLQFKIPSKDNLFNLFFAQHSFLNSLRGKLQILRIFSCLFVWADQTECKRELDLGHKQELSRGEVCLCSASLGGGEKLGCLFFLAVFGKWLTDFGHGREDDGHGRRQTKPYLE